MNQYACAITGHRPTRFCFGYNEEDPLCQKLKECLLEQFRILHDEKFVHTFFVGGGLLSVVDGKMGIGIYGPSLDAKGNSIAGRKILQFLSSQMKLHIFAKKD